jgi:segregation and condensation protein B
MNDEHDDMTGEATIPAAPDRREDMSRHLRMLEAVLFASGEPLDETVLASRLPEGADIPALLADLASLYERRGVNLVRLAGRWTFRTAPDLAFLLQNHVQEQRRLSRAGMETLAIIAYHQPVTRAEIEDIRGVTVSKGTIDVLLELGWIKMRGRRKVPGRPVTYGVTEAFLTQFGLDAITDLPGLDELKAAGLLDQNAGGAPLARPVSDALTPTEDPLDGEIEEDEPTPAANEIEADDAAPPFKMQAAE